MQAADDAVAGGSLTAGGDARDGDDAFDAYISEGAVKEGLQRYSQELNPLPHKQVLEAGSRSARAGSNAQTILPEKDNQSVSDGSERAQRAGSFRGSPGKTQRDGQSQLMDSGYSEDGSDVAADGGDCVMVVTLSQKLSSLPAAVMDADLPAWCMISAAALAALVGGLLFALVTSLWGGQHSLAAPALAKGVHQPSTDGVGSSAGWEEVDVFGRQSGMSWSPPPLPQVPDCAPGFAQAKSGYYECAQLGLDHPQRCASLTPSSTSSAAGPDKAAGSRLLTGGASDTAALHPAGPTHADEETILRCSHMCMFSTKCLGFSLIRMAGESTLALAPGGARAKVGGTAPHQCFLYSHFEGTFLPDSRSLTCTRRKK